VSSTRRIESSRANGAKSRGPKTPEGKQAAADASTGPVTPEGKAIVSQNAVTHGILSQSIVLPSESMAAFEHVLNGLRDELQPVTPIEHRQAEIMALADWRRQRVWCFEMAILTHSLYAQERLGDEEANRENAVIPAMHTALAFANLNNQSTILQNLNRYEARYGREYNRAYRLFKENRAERLQKENSSKQTNLTSEKY